MRFAIQTRGLIDRLMDKIEAATSEEFVSAKKPRQVES